MPEVSVIIPAYNAAHLIGACLLALRAQRLAADRFEVIVVDDGSTDDTSARAQALGARTRRVSHRGPPAARNAGIEIARGDWIACTDADCIPSSVWLARLLAAAHRSPGCLGLAGRTLGYRSVAPAARLVDLMGGLDPQNYLNHPKYPYAPTGNVMYRRADLNRIGGFDPRIRHEGCDVALRLKRAVGGDIVHEPTALVLHRHRESWRAYFRQQRGYGENYAHFLLKWRHEVTWGVSDELRAWASLLADAAGPAPSGPEGWLIRRGRFVRGLALRIGFLGTYWSREARDLWLSEDRDSAARAGALEPAE